MLILRKSSISVYFFPSPSPTIIVQGIFQECLRHVWIVSSFCVAVLIVAVQGGTWLFQIVSPVFWLSIFAHMLSSSSGFCPSYPLFLCLSYFILGKEILLACCCYDADYLLQSFLPSSCDICSTFFSTCQLRADIFRCG